MMFSNSRGSASWLGVVTENVKAWDSDIGSSPKRPAANCAFCSRTAAAMSPGVRLYCATLSGRSQIRIE